jgi:hypothetical protein
VNVGVLVDASDDVFGLTGETPVFLQAKGRRVINAKRMRSRFFIVTRVLKQKDHVSSALHLREPLKTHLLKLFHLEANRKSKKRPLTLPSPASGRGLKRMNRGFLKTITQTMYGFTLNQKQIIFKSPGF